ncbi:hypothetical protein JCM8547_002123 [Rhodosporidiobolus lusitaniae]
MQPASPSQLSSRPEEHAHALAWAKQDEQHSLQDPLDPLPLASPSLLLPPSPQANNQKQQAYLDVQPVYPVARSVSSASNSAYPLFLEDLCDPLPRSYSATSDIRGTLEHQDGAEQWEQKQEQEQQGDLTPVLAEQYEAPVYTSTRTFYEPRPYPLERADSLPIRPLRRSLYTQSPAPLHTPSLTADGSLSPATSRSSFAESVGSSYVSAIVEEQHDPRFHGSTPYASYRPQEEGYPFPDMHAYPYTQQQQHRPATTSTLPSSYYSPALSTPQYDFNPYRKRSYDDCSRPHTTQQLQSAFNDFSFRSSLGSSSSSSASYAYPPAPPTATPLERRMSYQGAHYSGGGGVYEVNGARQLFLPPPSSALYPQQEEPQLLPPFQPVVEDAYEDAMKKRRTSSAGGAELSHSLSQRRESAPAVLHLDLGLPHSPPPPSSTTTTLEVFPEGVEEQQHYALPAPPQEYKQQTVVYPSVLPQTPLAPPMTRAHTYGGYASFASSPSYLDRMAPLPATLDSPVESPNKQRRFAPPYNPYPSPPPLPLAGTSSSVDYLSAPTGAFPAPFPHTPTQPPPSASTSSFPPYDSSYPPADSSSFPSVLAPPASASTSTTHPCTAHRDPPQRDFDAPPPGGEPYEQKLRFEEDQYTPKWVRFEKKDKEGWCALCPGEGKWLQLKNSAFWYHRQFVHGVSSSSGHFFLPPLELRQDGDSGKVSGLCHSCAEWHPYQSSVKTSMNASAAAEGKGAKPPSQWFHHAHKCHTYFSPRKEARKNAKLGI